LCNQTLKTYKKSIVKENKSVVKPSWILNVEDKSNGFDLHPVGLLKEAITRDVRVFASFLYFHMHISLEQRNRTRERERERDFRSYLLTFFPSISANLRATFDLYRIF